MEVILDTNFILSCVKNKIDFLSAGEFGELTLPLEVIDELRKIAAKKKGKDKNNAKLALDIIQNNREKFNIIKLGKKFVDAGIKKYIEKKKTIIATLDKELKKALKGKSRILVIRGKKKLSLE